jgi:hypothetical protein
MQVFTMNDVANSRCTHEEVGMPWEARYGIDDHLEGGIPMHQVGSAKPIVLPELEDIDDAEGLGPTTDWIRAAFNGMGGRKAFVAYCKKNPAQMWPLLLKGGLAQFLKEEPVTKNLDDLTLADMQEMSSAEIKLLLLKSEGITTKSQVEALNAKNEAE